MIYSAVLVDALLEVYLSTVTNNLKLNKLTKSPNVTSDYVIWNLGDVPIKIKVMKNQI